MNREAGLYDPFCLESSPPPKDWITFSLGKAVALGGKSKEFFIKIIESTSVTRSLLGDVDGVTQVQKQFERTQNKAKPANR